MMNDGPIFRPAAKPDNRDVDRALWAGFSPERIRAMAQAKAQQDAANAPRPVPVDPMSQAANNMDVDRDMWTGYTPTPKRPSPEFPSKARHQVDKPTTVPLPKRRPPFMPLFGQRVAPPYQEPSVWAQPFHKAETVCLTYYETEYTVLSKTVPDTRIIMTEAIGYEFERNKFPVGNVLLIRVKRDGEVMAEWEEFVAANTANPAERYAFGSVLNPVPCKVRVDKNQNLTVTVTAKGPLPFNKSPADLLVAEAKVVVYGYMDQLRDTRDNGIKPLVSGGERGQDHWNHILESVLDYRRAMPSLMPYFDEKFTTDMVSPFADEVNMEASY